MIKARPEVEGLKPYVAPLAEAREAVAKAYPNLASRPFRCLLCR